MLSNPLPKPFLLTSPQCNAIHRSILEQFKTAVVYGKSVKHQPQRVGLSHELCDEDIGMSLSLLTFFTLSAVQ
jgi:hypothetical protein